MNDNNSYRNRFFKNIGWLAIGKGGYLLLSFLVTLTVVRYLGPYDFGTINYVDAYVKFAHVIATFGLDAIIIKEVAGGRKNNNTVVWTATLIRLVFGTILGIGVTLLIFITEGKDPFMTKIAVLESLYLVFVAFHSLFDYFQASLQSKWNAIAEMVAYLGTSLFRVVLLIIKADVLWFAFALSLDMLIMAVILGRAYLKQHGFHPVFSRNEAHSLMSQSWYYMVAGLLTVAFTQIDRIMIEKMLGRSDLGEYSVTTNFATLWVLVSAVMVQAATPVIYKAFTGDRKIYLRRMRQSYAAVLWLNIIFAVMVCIFARQIILIFYGAEYLNATSTLRIVVWHFGLSTVSLITQAHLSNEGKSYYVLWICLVGIICDVGMNALLIPYMGIEGAALSTLITQLIIQLIMPMSIKGMRECGVEMVKGIALWKVMDRDEWSSIRCTCRSLARKVVRKK